MRGRPIRTRAAPWPVEAASALTLLALLAYFALHAFRWPWEGDAHLYLAGVAELMRDPNTARHEASLAPAAASHVYTPYVRAVAWLGRALDVDPYRALQRAAVLDLTLYFVGLAVFARAWSAWRGSLLPAALLAVIATFLRDRAYSWSSDTSFVGLRLIAAYPSMAAWGLALLALAAAMHASRTGARWAAGALAALLSMLFATHLITAAWVAGVALALAIPSRRALVVVAIVAAALVAHRDIAENLAFAGVAEGAPFAGKALATFGRLLLLAVPAAIVLGTRGAHRATALAAAVTLLGMLVLTAAGLSYGARFGLFFGLFPALVVADATALALARAIEGRQPWGLAPLAIVVSMCATGPALRDWARRGQPLASPAALWSRPSTAAAHWARTDAYARLLGVDDVLLAPPDGFVLELAAATGARAVFSPFAYRIPDGRAREAELAAFFAPGAAIEARRAAVERWRATHVLAPEGLRGELEPWLGPPLLATGGRALFEAR